MHLFKLLISLTLPLALNAQSDNTTSPSTKSAEGDNSLGYCVACAITCGAVFAACAFAAVIPGMIEACIVSEEGGLGELCLACFRTCGLPPALATGPGAAEQPNPSFSAAVAAAAATPPPATPDLSTFYQGGGQQLGTGQTVNPGSNVMWTEPNGNVGTSKRRKRRSPPIVPVRGED